MAPSLAPPPPRPDSLISPGDDLVRQVTLHRQRHWSLHGHVAPFAAAYAGWAYAWLFALDASEQTELCLISLAAVVVAQILLCLSCHWSVHVMAAMTCAKVGVRGDESWFFFFFL